MWVLETAQRFGVLPTAVLDSDERLLQLLEIEKYAFREEAS
ncbi:hypothetical protein ACFWIW_10645 [Amycolatopsis sp. NPDC058340]